MLIPFLTKLKASTGLTEYQPLGDQEGPAGESFLDNKPRLHFLESRSLLFNVLVGSLLSSVLANGICFFQHIWPQSVETCSNKTKYASLERNIPIPWTHDNDFNSHNRTVLDNAWDTLDEDVGVVALSDAFVEEKRLHPAQRFPWDDSKGIYHLQSHHNLHCLNIIRTALMEMHDKVPQSLHFPHVSHCLDAFRQDIICNADDTPRYTGLSQQSSSGVGQNRLCRDWGKLEQWAKKHSACYKYNPAGTTDPKGDPLSRYRFCPDGSKPWE